MDALLIETAARQAAYEGSGDACEILTTEATVILSLYGGGEAYLALKNVPWAQLSNIEKAKVAFCALGLCNPKQIESVAGESRIVVESSMQVVRDMRRVDSIRDWANAARPATTHLPK